MTRMLVQFTGDWAGILPGDSAVDQDNSPEATGRRTWKMVRVVPPRTSVKDVIESPGVPHTEIGAARIRSASTGLCHALDSQSRPRAEQDCGIEVEPVPRVAGAPVEPSPRFAVDVHLGGLAVRLRLLGFDTLYRTCWGDADLAFRAIVERLWLLTRGRGLLKRGLVQRGCLVQVDRPWTPGWLYRSLRRRGRTHPSIRSGRYVTAPRGGR
jgi:hypothetical protein